MSRAIASTASTSHIRIEFLYSNQRLYFDETSKWPIGPGPFTRINSLGQSEDFVNGPGLVQAWWTIGLCFRLIMEGAYHVLISLT